jgi:hypothetical protein
MDSSSGHGHHHYDWKIWKDALEHESHYFDKHSSTVIHFDTTVDGKYLQSNDLGCELLYYDILAKKQETSATRVADYNNKLDDDDFLRAFWILYFEHDDKKEKDFQQFEDDLFNQKYSITDIKNNEYLSEHKLEHFLGTLSDGIKFWFLINNPKYTLTEPNSLLEYNNQILNKLLQINTINKGRFMKTLCMAILLKRKQNQEEILDLFEIIERHNFAIYLLFGKQADTNRVEIYRSINQYYREGINPSKHYLTYQDLKQKIKNITEKHMDFTNIENHIHTNRQTNYKFYDWNGVKYLLWNYEASLQGKITLEIDEINKYNIDLISDWFN